MSACIVGGTGGIGLRIATKLANSGMDVTIHGRNMDKLLSIQKAFQQDGILVSVLGLTISPDCDPGPLLEAAAASDILVYAHGPFMHKTLACTGADDWKDTVYGNLTLPGLTASIAAPGMASRGFGRILFFGGTRTDTVRGFKHNAAYASAKIGLGVLAKSIAAEFSGRGVSAAVICPGFVETEYLSAIQKTELAKQAPRGALIRTDAITDLAVELLTGAMDLCNGAVITADEGLYAW